jgi:hypothetical protein
MLKNGLSTNTFGNELMEKLADLLVENYNNPHNSHRFGFSHRDYCGHGLIYGPEGFSLVEIWEGGPAEVLKSWKHKPDFVSFFAEQSDFSCSGFPGCDPLFKAKDEFFENNQRITKKRLVGYVDKKPGNWGY